MCLCVTTLSMINWLPILGFTSGLSPSFISFWGVVLCFVMCLDFQYLSPSLVLFASDYLGYSWSFWFYMKPGVVFFPLSLKNDLRVLRIVSIELLALWTLQQYDFFLTHECGICFHFCHQFIYLVFYSCVLYKWVISVLWLVLFRCNFLDFFFG